MPAVSAKEVTVPATVVQHTTATTGLTALGIVYGDLGTDPLYTMQAVLQIVDILGRSDPTRIR
jgi:K+ transporter